MLGIEYLGLVLLALVFFFIRGLGLDLSGLVIITGRRPETSFL